MAEILTTCEVPGTMLGVDCTEYPCIARFRADADTLDAITSCPTWTNRYGLGAGMAQVAADCGAGRKEAVLLLHVDGWREGWKRLDEDGNVSKRTSARQQEMLAEWPCL